MKWNTAVKIIEKAQANRETVCIEYHRKHLVNDRHFGVVDVITTYEFCGETCKGINTYRDVLDEDSFIIDSIEIL